MMLAPAIFGGVFVLLGLYLVLRRDKETKELHRRNSAMVNEHFSMIEAGPQSPPRSTVASTHENRTTPSGVESGLEAVNQMKAFQNSVSSTEL
jgi:hypothetical protein